jgi:molybdate transport system ATP-binding protein
LLVGCGAGWVDNMLHIQVEKHRDGFTLNAEINAPTPGVIALFGRSGCGKSTLINSIAGLLTPDKGRIELNGQLLFDSTTKINVPVEHRRIGYVFQDARLFPHLSIHSNLLYGLRRARGAAVITFDNAVAMLGLQPLLKRRPHQLSGGERQRVALGRALLSSPQLLLLDEPLASLDVARREEVLPYLEKLRDQLALPMVYVSHQFDEVLRLATHVVVIDKGQVAASGSINEISLAPVLREIVGPDAMGAVLDGEVVAYDSKSALADIAVAGGVLRVQAETQVGTRVRVQLLARDIILATQRPEQLSVRNMLAGKILDIARDDQHADLIKVGVGDATLIARITRAATVDLQLRADQFIWVLVKAVSLRGHALTV